MEASDSFRFYNCARCKQQVRICRQCDRGQLYCSSECSNIRRRESLRAAQSRYQRSSQGARKHAARQRKYRSEQNKVTHQGSLPTVDAAPSPQCQKASRNIAFSYSSLGYGLSKATGIHYPAACRCHFCGRVGSSFMRTGFMRTKRIVKGVLQL